MNPTESIEVYNKLARPPKSALREIQAGKLKGKTDINPQWRYKAMTEQFGLVGIGWKYEIQNLWIEQGASNEKLAFAQVAVYVKDGDKWSDPIVGIGGSKLSQVEKGTLVSNDEGYKMAVTDAFSTALKMLGVAADIYAGRWDGTKYKDAADQQPQRPAQQEQVQLKGGPSTPEEVAKIRDLLESKYADGTPVFSKEEKLTYSSYRKEKYTAKELITFIENALKNRLPQTAEPAEFKEDIPWEEPAPQPGFDIV